MNELPKLDPGDLTDDQAKVMRLLFNSSAHCVPDAWLGMWTFGAATVDLVEKGWLVRQGTQLFPSAQANDLRDEIDLLVTLRNQANEEQ